MPLGVFIHNWFKCRCGAVAEHASTTLGKHEQTGTTVPQIASGSEKKDRHIEPEDLYILHLSDLHISNGNLLHAHRCLINDVQKQLHGVKRMAVVISGDIVEQGDYSEENIKVVKEFFRNLKSVIPSDCDLAAVEVVPGNHEPVLPVKSNGFNDGTYRAVYDKYEELKAAILKSFDFQVYDKNNCTTQIGYHDRSICFIRVDTSWTKSESEIVEDIQKDIRKHPTLKMEAEELKEATGKIIDAMQERVDGQKKFDSKSFSKAVSDCEAQGRPIVCTIAVSHYPITWLLSVPYEKIRDLLFDRGLPDVNIWLCGHAHQAQLYFNNDDAKSTLMLMTGVGRRTSSRYQHRYSIYRLNLERNTIGVKIRSIGTGVLDQFDTDTELFGNLRRGCDYFPFPLVYNQAGAFHRLNSPRTGGGENILLDRDTVSVFREVSLRTGVLFARLKVIVQDELHEFEEGMLKDDHQDRKLTHDILMAENETDIKEDITQWKETALLVIKKHKIVEHLLELIASETEEVFTKHVAETGLVVEDSYVSNSAFKSIDWRVHFRKYTAPKDGVFSSDCDVYSAISLSDAHKPKDVPFTGTIEAATKTKERLVVKSVSGVENPVRTDWSDFLTGIPNFADNKIEFKVGMGTIERPLLTYGISVRYESHDSCLCASRILFGMDFAMLNRCLTYALFDFTRRIKCDFEKMITQMEG